MLFVEDLKRCLAHVSSEEVLLVQRQCKARVVHMNKTSESLALSLERMTISEGLEGVPVFQPDLLVKYQICGQVIETNLPFMVMLPFCYLG